MLLAGLFVVWVAQVPERGVPNLQELASVGEAFFDSIVGIQLSLVLLAAPAYTAGAICLDKSRGVLTHLLVTDLSDTEIVLGKLAARLLIVLALLFATLPVLALATLLGGISPEALLGSFLVAIGTAVLCCTLALTLSVVGRQTHEVMLATYAVEAVWLLALPISELFLRPFPNVLQRSNPFWLAFAPYTHPRATDLIDYLLFLGWCLGLSVLLAVIARFSIRPVVTGIAFGRSARCAFVGVAIVLFVAGTIEIFLDRCRDFFLMSGGLLILFGYPAYLLFDTVRTSKSGKLRRRSEVVPAPEPFDRKTSAWRAWQEPSLDNNPVLWCEWRTRRSGRWMRGIAWFYAIGAGFFGFLAVGQALGGWNFGHEFPALVNAFIVSLGFLLFTVSAVTSVAEDRNRGTLDILLTTPLSTGTIVWGKWWATFCHVPLVAMIPALVAGALALKTGRFGIAFLVVLLTLGYGATVTSMGLLLATWIRRVGLAIAIGVVSYVLVTVGWVMVIIALFGRDDTTTGPGLAIASPFWGPGLMTVDIQDDFSPLRKNLVYWAMLWIAIYLAAANMLLAMAYATFDRCMGRASQSEM